MEGIEDVRRISSASDVLSNDASESDLVDSQFGGELDGGLHALGDDELNYFREIFALFDKDSSGSIDASEVGALMKSLGYRLDEQAVADFLTEADCDRSGELSFDEFVRVIEHRRSDSDVEQEIRQAFRVFDKNCDGFIDAAELRHMMGVLGEGLSIEEVDEMMREADLDANGMIDFEEFHRMLTSS